MEEPTKIESSDHPLSPTERLTFMKNGTLAKLEELRGSRNQYSSRESNAQLSQEWMKKKLLAEKQDLFKMAEEIDDPIILLKIETREKEIEKELIDLQIEWLEKQMWDLYTETSDEKTKLAEKVSWLKRGDLLLAIINNIGALRGEQLWSAGNGVVAEDAGRVGYREDEIKKLEDEFREIDKMKES